MPWQLQDGVLGMLAREEEVLPQCLRTSEVRAAQGKIPQPPEDGQQLRGIPDALAQFIRACVDGLDLGGTIAFGSTQRRTEDGLQNQFVPETLRTLWERLQ